MSTMAEPPSFPFAFDALTDFFMIRYWDNPKFPEQLHQFCIGLAKQYGGDGHAPHTANGSKLNSLLE